MTNPIATPPTDKALNPQVKPLYKPIAGEPENTAWSAIAQYNNTRAIRDAKVVA